MSDEKAKKQVRFPGGQIMPLWSAIEHFMLTVPFEHTIEDVMQSTYFTSLWRILGRNRNSFAIINHAGGEFTIGVIFTKVTETEVLFKVLFGEVSGGVITKPELEVSGDGLISNYENARVDHGGGKVGWRVLAADGTTLADKFGGKREAEEWLARKIEAIHKKAA